MPSKADTQFAGKRYGEKGSFSSLYLDDEWTPRVPRLQVGDEIVVLRGDGERKPDLAGRRGTVAAITPHVIWMEVEGFGKIKSRDLWWKRNVPQIDA